MIFASNS